MHYTETGPIYCVGAQAPEDIQPWISSIAWVSGLGVLAHVGNRSEVLIVPAGGDPVASIAVDEGSSLIPGAEGKSAWILRGPGSPIREVSGTGGPDPLSLRSPKARIRSGLVLPDESALLVTQDGALLRFSRFGLVPVPLPDGTPRVWSIAAGPDEGFLLVHRQGCAVTLLSADLTPLWKFGGVAGHKPDQLASPEHATTWGRRVVVTDTRNNRLAVLDDQGALVRHVAGGAVGSDNGLLSYPNSACVDGIGRLVVGDAGNSRLVAYDGLDAERSTLWGRPMVSRNRFQYPRSAEIDAAGRVLVADSYNQRVLRLDASGPEDTSWHDCDGLDFWWPRHAITVDDSVHIVDSRNRRLLHEERGRLVEKPLTGPEGARFVHGDPHFLRPLASGFLLSDTDANRVSQFDQSGRLVASWGGEPHHSARASVVPDQVEVDVKDCHDGLLSDDGQTVWLVDTGNNRLLQMRRDGSNRRTFEPRGALLAGRGLAYPRSISIVDGFIAISDAGNHRLLVCRLDDGEAVWSFGGAGRGLSTHTLDDPRFVRLVRTPRGLDLTAVDYGNHRILTWNLGRLPRRQ